MICPKCGKRMFLVRIEFRPNEVAYIYKCEHCGHRVEVSLRRTRTSLWGRWPPRHTPMYGRA